MELQSISKPATETAAAAKLVGVETRSVSPGFLGSLGAKPPQKRVFGKEQRPLSQRRGFETVLGDVDERTRVTVPKETPWRMICSLEIEAPLGNFVGTGWFVGPATLVTAGHCVFDSAQMGGWAKRITITPGRDDENKPFGSIVSEKFSTVDKWKNEQNPDFDMAAIHLDKATGEQLGWFAVGALTDDELTGYMVNISGYPAEPGGGVQQWWSKNRIRQVRPRRIFYDVDTSGGQSGAPVYVYENENSPPIVVGIHAYGIGGTPGDIPLRVNSAPRIIPEVVAQIQKWIDLDKPKAA
jgi:glutamyl endopeptidase